MKNAIAFLTLFISYTTIYSQTIDTIARNIWAKNMLESSKVNKGVEIPPKYNGGYGALYEYLITNIKYPKKAEKRGKKGEVDIYFVVDRMDGHLRDIKVQSSTDKIFEEAAMEVVQKMPNWIPAQQKGRNVNCSHTLPIKFNIPSS